MAKTKLGNRVRGGTFGRMQQAATDPEARQIELRNDLIRQGIRSKQTLRIRYGKTTRVVAPHRLWRQPDGTFLLEGYQIAGQSIWAPAGEGRFTRSRLHGWEGWASFKVEQIRLIDGANGRFRTRPDFNADPDRRPGDIVDQVRP